MYFRKFRIFRWQVLLLENFLPKNFRWNSVKLWTAVYPQGKLRSPSNSTKWQFGVLFTFRGHQLFHMPCPFIHSFIPIDFPSFVRSSVRGICFDFWRRATHRRQKSKQMKTLHFSDFWRRATHSRQKSKKCLMKTWHFFQFLAACYAPPPKIEKNDEWELWIVLL